MAGFALWSGDRRERRLRPGVSHRLRAARQEFCGPVYGMRAIGVARPLRSPRIGDGTGNREREFRLPIPVPHLAPIHRPVGAVAERRARLEPFGPEAKRHHGEMHGGAADRLAAVLAAHHERIGALRDAVVVPVELLLLPFVRSEVLERPEIGACVEADDGKALPARPARTGPPPAPVPTTAKSTSSSSANCRMGVHAPTRNTSGARPFAARGAANGSADTSVLPRRLFVFGRGRLRPAPTRRGGRGGGERSRAATPALPSRSRSTPPDGRNRRRPRREERETSKRSSEACRARLPPRKTRPPSERGAHSDRRSSATRRHGHIRVSPTSSSAARPRFHASPGCGMPGEAIALGLALAHEPDRHKPQAARDDALRAEA